MKKIIIGAIVATVIFFLYQATMWMGGFHNDFYKYTTKQDTLLQCMSSQLSEDGLYMMPMPDNKNNASSHHEHEEMMKEKLGKPWAMLFYHQRMEQMEAKSVTLGVLYALIAALVVASVLFAGNFQTFTSRFLTSMAFAVFALSLSVLDNMNWWSLPWSFVKTEAFDLILGWGISSVWLGWYMKKQG